MAALSQSTGGFNGTKWVEILLTWPCLGISLPSSLLLGDQLWRIPVLPSPGRVPKGKPQHCRIQDSGERIKTFVELSAKGLLGVNP